jgi:hypothetical protein
LTSTAKEELAKVVETCLEALAEQSRFEESLKADLKVIEGTVKHLDGRRGNEPVSAEVGNNIATEVRQAVNAIQVAAQGTHIILLLLLKVAVLAQQDEGANVETLADAKKELETWHQQWKAANEAWDNYSA